MGCRRRPRRAAGWLPPGSRTTAGRPSLLRLRLLRGMRVRGCATSLRLGSGTPAQGSRDDRSGLGATGRLRRGVLPEVDDDRRPDLRVLALLVLEVVFAEEPGERRAARVVPAPREVAAVVPEDREVVLEGLRHLALDGEEGRGVFPAEHRQVVELEHPLELLDRGRVVVDPEVDPAVAVSVACALADDVERRRLHSPSVAPLALAGR